MEGIGLAWHIGNWIKTMINRFHINDFKLVEYPNFQGFEVTIVNDNIPDLNPPVRLEDDDNERNK